MTTEAPSGTQQRTRRAILDAAVRVLAADQQASLAEIAEAADVGRTTLHRYFPERTDLIDALRAESVTSLHGANARARLDEGVAADALVRLGHEYFDLGDMLSLMFNGVCDLEQAEWADGDDDPSEQIRAVVARGHGDGSIDPAMSAAWVEGLLWCLLYLAWASVTQDGMARHEAERQTALTLAKAISPTR